MSRRKKHKKPKLTLIVSNPPDYGVEDCEGKAVLTKHFIAPKVWGDDPDQTGKPVLHRKNVTQTVLDRYFRNDFISERQWKVGERLRKQFRIAGLDSLVSIDMVRTGSGVPAWGIPTSEAAAHARQCIRKAFETVGKTLTRVLIAVIHDDRDVLGEISARNGFKNEPQKRAALAGIISLALDALADFYGEQKD